MTPTWYPETGPLTQAETAAAVVASDAAGTVEKSKIAAFQREVVTWDDVWATALTEDDRRAWR